MISSLNRSWPERFYHALFGNVEWNIGIVHQPISSFLKRESKPKVHWLPRFETGKFLADPFGIQKNGKLHIICEEFDCRTSKGRIVSVELGRGAAPRKPRVAIELPIHMSYPFLLEHRGSIYCVPETCQAREVGLFKAIEFPHRWTKVGSLLTNIGVLDSTIFRYEGLWWLACTREENRLSKLFIWYASDLFGPWKPHAANPVKNDIRSSRPAGTPFFYKGYLYRPAQDCSQAYGKRIVINRVLKLTPREFKEEPASVIEPNCDGKYPHGVHTVSGAGSMTILDGKCVRHGAPSFRRLYESIVLER